MDVRKVLLASAVLGILSPGCARSAPSPSAPSTDIPAPVDKNCCRGRNDCRGQSGCRGEAHACAGQNACRGQGTACPRAE